MAYCQAQGLQCGTVDRSSFRGSVAVTRVRWNLDAYSSFAALMRDATAGHTQRDVAAACRVSQGRVSRWVSGYSVPGKPEVIAATARWLGVTPTALKGALARWRPEQVEPSAAAELRSQLQRIHRELASMRQSVTALQATVDALKSHQVQQQVEQQQQQRTH